MSLPTRTVTGTFLDPTTQKPCSGTITFVPNTTLAATTSLDIIPAEPVTVSLDYTGTFTVSLIPTDVAEISPSGWAYTVTERITGPSGPATRTYNILIPTSANPLNLATAVPLVTPPALAQYVLLTSVGQIGGPAGPLDGTGKVPAAQLPALGGGIPASTVTTKGDLIVATANATVTRHGVGSDGQILTADSSQPDGVAWKAQKPPIIRSAYITTGNITLPLTSGAWQAVSGIELDLPAVAGEYVELAPSFMWQPSGSSAFLDLGVLVGTSIVRYASSGGSSPALAGEGDPSLYINPGTFRTAGTVFGFTVGAGDLDAGNVRFVLLCKTNTAAGTLYASTNYPFRWRARNDRVVG